MGTSGSTQGERNVSAPAKNKAGKVKFMTCLVRASFFDLGSRESFSLRRGSYMPKGHGRKPLALTKEGAMSRLLAKNEHFVDRALRVLLGLGLLSLTFVGPHTALGYIGLVPLATGLLGSCPLYSIFGFSTSRVSPHGGG
jgi:Protein of unknown function (DUF2892)